MHLVFSNLNEIKLKIQYTLKFWIAGLHQLKRKFKPGVMNIPAIGQRCVTAALHKPWGTVPPEMGKRGGTAQVGAAEAMAAAIRRGGRSKGNAPRRQDCCQVQTDV